MKASVEAEMETVRRILVHLSKENSLPQCARFVQSITGHFNGSHNDSVTVNCVLENNKFILSDHEVEGNPGLILKRAHFCPIKHLSESEASILPVDIRDRGVDVGVAILLQSANEKILLTRRAANLAIFPNVWVPPGGHVELGEKLLDAGMRELQEETGITLGPEEYSSQMLGLWESVFPPMLSRGLPCRHHIVSYVLIQSTQTHHELQERLRPNPQEVSACVWVGPAVVQAIVSSIDGEDDCGRVPDDLPETVRISEVMKDGVLHPTSLPLSVLINKATTQGPDVERVSTGTKFALELWLKTLVIAQRSDRNQNEKGANPVQ
ncbi:nucleoside diphosphate-linked moiety X motif 17 isoform X1 [Erpetoichthys calabaricus]|uniref:nucleoside diphosphate-linked moiety X motif 17 isoform X1 n=2 Tax=Erpetoichthys calabaricus TaxID=27687 RepID=UPI00109FE2C7|nr:nucleoside diphosphate-linked moiety X motif 17 isoform X1 [Erpetoichthys calabaricus]